MPEGVKQELDLRIRQEGFQASNPEELYAYLAALVEDGQITGKQANDYYGILFGTALENYIKGLGGSWEDIVPLFQYTSTEDLLDRLAQFQIDDIAKANLYRYIRSEMTPDEERNLPAKIRATAGRLGRTGRSRDLALLEMSRATTTATLINQIQSALSNGLINDTEAADLYDQFATPIQEAEAAKGAEAERVKALEAPLLATQTQQLKDMYLPGLKTSLDTAVRAGTMTQEQATNQYSYEESLLDQGYDLNVLPNYQNQKALGLIQTSGQALGKEAQAKADIINRQRRETEANRLAEQQGLFQRSEEAGIGTLIKQFQREQQERVQEAGRPELPGLQGVAEAYLKETGFGEGTKLRSYIESQMPEIAQGISAEREAWWRRMNPLAPIPETQAAVPTYETRLGQAQRDVREREAILQAGGTTSPQAIYATTQRDLAQKRLAGLETLGQEGYFAQERAKLPRTQYNPAGYYDATGLADIVLRRPAPEEDPFLTALRKQDLKDLTAKYYRRPGTGLVSRLTPSVRFR